MIAGATPFTHYLQVRELFFLEQGEEDLLFLLRHPFAENFPLTQALSYWFAFRKKKPHPPLFFSWEGELPIAYQAELAVLWAELGEKTQNAQATQASLQLAESLYPLIKNGFDALWTKEELYDKEQAQEAFAKFSDRFRDFGFVTHSENFIPTPKGERSSLGSVHIGSIQIPAFGIQASPLSHSELFGVDFILEEKMARVSSEKEVWVQLDSTSQENGLSFSLRNIGLKGEKPLFFCFYIRGSRAQISDRAFIPQSLIKFQGEASKIKFDTKIFFETDRPLWTELIPLAADKSFWGASFLLAFPLSFEPFTVKILLD